MRSRREAKAELPGLANEHQVPNTQTPITSTSDTKLHVVHLVRREKAPSATFPNTTESHDTRSARGCEK